MKIKRPAYALTEMLVIIAALVVLISLSIRPLRTLVSEIPQSVRVCLALNGTTKALDQLRNDIEQANHIAGLKNSVLTLEHSNGPVRYILTEGKITRRPAMNDFDSEFTWQLPNVSIETNLWLQNNHPYAVELTTWDQQNTLGRNDVRFKQTVVFFRKGQQ